MKKYWYLISAVLMVGYLTMKKLGKNQDEK